MIVIDVEAVVATIRELGGEAVDRVILYGSFAWGGWDPESSDIDVAVLLRETDRLAIDDLHEGDELDDWPAAERHRLILTDPTRGLSDPAALNAIRVEILRSQGKSGACA